MNPFSGLCVPAVPEGMLLCFNCRRIKTLAGFYRSASSGKPRRPCKECLQDTARRWDRDNRERVNEKRNAANAALPPEVREQATNRMRAYYETHKAAILAQQREYRARKRREQGALT
jgi:hypothetical protein